MKSFAVVLNMQARKVNKKVVNLVAQHVDTEDLYITHTVEQSDQSLDEIIKKRYPLVLCGGGDGTVMRIIEQIRAKVNAHNKAGGDYKMPKFGMLKLGTGNGWAGLMDVPSGVEPIWAIRRFTEPELVFETFNMIEGDNRLFHFGGFGVDALVLNDYIDMKRRFTDGFMWKLANSLFGYLAVIFFKSLPKVLFKGFKLNIRVINESDKPIYQASASKGVTEVPIKKGDTIYEGPVDSVVFGTTTDYGFKLRVMPFAMDKPGYFHLRLVNMGVAKMVARLKSIWQGTVEHPALWDYLVEECRIEVDEKAPFQLGGDPEGYREKLHIKISDFKPQVLDFRKLLS